MGEAIYVRNTFKVKWNRGEAFLEGKKRFIQESGWQLIAAFAEWPLLSNGHLIEREVEMVHIWKVKRWDTLYETMTKFSECGWYRDLGSTLATEDHDMLIDATVRPATLLDTAWRTPNDPGYVYVYEESRTRDRYNFRYLQEAYWFSAQMAALTDGRGWELVFCSSQITSQPAELVFVWRVPAPTGWSAEMVPNELMELVKVDHSRYDHMMGLLQTTKRRILFPTFTEKLYLDYIQSQSKTLPGQPMKLAASGIVRIP